MIRLALFLTLIINYGFASSNCELTIMEYGSDSPIVNAFTLFPEEMLNSSEVMSLSIDEDTSIELVMSQRATDGKLVLDSGVLSHRGGNGKVIFDNKLIDNTLGFFNPLTSSNFNNYNFGNLSESFSYQNSRGVMTFIQLNCLIL